MPARSDRAQREELRSGLATEWSASLRRKSSRRDPAIDQATVAASAPPASNRRQSRRAPRRRRYPDGPALRAPPPRYSRSPWRPPRQPTGSVQAARAGGAWRDRCECPLWSFHRMIDLLQPWPSSTAAPSLSTAGASRSPVSRRRRSWTRAATPSG